MGTENIWKINNEQQNHSPISLRVEDKWTFFLEGMFLCFIDAIIMLIMTLNKCHLSLSTYNNEDITDWSILPP